MFNSSRKGSCAFIVSPLLLMALSLEAASEFKELWTGYCSPLGRDNGPGCKQSLMFYRLQNGWKHQDERLSTVNVSPNWRALPSRLVDTGRTGGDWHLLPHSRVITLQHEPLSDKVTGTALQKNYENAVIRSTSLQRTETSTNRQITQRRFDWLIIYLQIVCLLCHVDLLLLILFIWMRFALVSSGSISEWTL